LRSPRQIAVRAGQELVNLRLTVLPPDSGFGAEVSPALRFADPIAVAHSLAGSRFAQQVTDLANKIRSHQFPIFGFTLDTGPEIRWRRDYMRGIEGDCGYFRRIPYFDTRRAGDHKLIWELNRHQHLVVLAQAYLLTGDMRNLDELCAQLESWMADNPFHRGINWASALEVALRAISWIWVDHSVGTKLPLEFRGRWLHVLYLHGCHLADNLSFYFSPNNHLVGEALALHALGLFFRGCRRARRWEQLGATVMRQEMMRQIRADGSSFEQSTYYQVYLLDMFLLHAILAHPGPEYLARLGPMAEYLHAVTGPARLQPFLGDDDGGRLFHPYGCRERFHRATLATASIFLDRTDWLVGPDDLHEQAAWWLGADVFQRAPVAGNWESRLFPDSGIAVMTSGTTHAVIDAGPFGALHSGHSHSDTLSIVLRSGEDEILVDSGTYTYTGDAYWRDRFRGTAAHNTIRIDGLDQAVRAGPFRWTDKPEVRILDWRTNSERDFLEAECRYANFVHRRRVEFQKPDAFLITDVIGGPPGEHDVEQFWHLGSLAAGSKLILPDGAELKESWRSTTFGEKHPSPIVRVCRRGKLPICLETRIDLRSGR
jgi:Heparinase II/III-like protein/Heparinase II/III N-terminus